MKFTQIDTRGQRIPSAGPSGTVRGPGDDTRPPSAWRMVRLVCGHYTTPETQAVYSLWKPARGKQFCESCGRWCDKAPKPKAQRVGTVPLF